MPFLRRRQRKILGVLFVLITTLFVYWTLKSRAELNLRVNGRIPLENVDSSRSGSDIKFNAKDYSRTETKEDGFKEILYSSKPVNEKELIFLPRTKAEVTDESPLIGLQQRLKKIEKKILENKLPNEQPKVMFVNSVDAQQEIVILYKKTFRDLGYKVILVNDVTELSSFGKTTWQGLLCFRKGNSTNPLTECPVSFYDHVQHLTQVSPIQGMEKLLLRNDGFCYMTSASRHLSALESKPLSPPCFVLPAQFKSLAAEKKQGMSQWTVKSHGADITHLEKWGYSLRTSEKEISANSGGAVVQRLPGNALLVDDQPVVVLVYVLITSVSPLRLYRHSEGRMQFLVQNGSERRHWSLGMFINRLENQYGKSLAKAAIQQMDERIVSLFLVFEPSLQTYYKGLKIGQPAVREQQGFQLLQISVMFNSSFYPYVLEVKDAKDEGVPQSTVQDTVNIVFSLLVKTNISQEVHEALNVLKIPSSVKKTGCQSVMGKCITAPFLHYLLQMRWEANHSGKFKKLYPSPRGGKFNEFISRLSSEGTTVEDHFSLKCDQCTPELHHILTAYEVQCQINKPAVDLLRDGSDGGNPITDSAIDVQTSEGGERGTDCDTDEDPVLLELHTQPTVILQPPFKPDVFIYQATVPFDTMVLKVWGRASSCKSDVRINSKSLKSQFSNHSLGVGWNKFTVYVMDTSQSPAAAEYMYTLDVFRQRRSEKEARFTKESRHEVCAQLQDCDLEVFPGKSCGLSKLPHVSWEAFLLGQQQLGLCGTGHKPGRWVLPCGSCDDPKSCYWKKAVWAPYTCQYNVLSREQVRTCLADKKILFVGDSTNRGIMYYLMEKLNGSLRKWEKTHAMKIYTDELNGSRTSVSFAYYPQFWLSNNMRPVFVKALYQLIARFLPLENSTNTILVIGGVQWMGPHHITETRKALSSLGLNGIKVVVKSLGAGFHLPIPGLLRQDLAGQRKTAQRNWQVIEAAEKLSYDVVDTFSITVSRYKEFLQGKCSCHFHKVVDMESLMRETEEIPSPLLDKDERYTNFHSRYHVIGPINSVYSELVINRMCS